MVHILMKIQTITLGIAIGIKCKLRILMNIIHSFFNRTIHMWNNINRQYKQITDPTIFKDGLYDGSMNVINSYHAYIRRLGISSLISAADLSATTYTYHQCIPLILLLIMEQKFPGSINWIYKKKADVIICSSDKVFSL